MIFTQPEQEPSLRPPTPFLTLSNLVTSPLQLQRPLAASRALLSWDLLSPVLLTDLLFPDSPQSSLPSHRCRLPACSPSPLHLPTDTIIPSHSFICFVCLSHC